MAASDVGEYAGHLRRTEFAAARKRPLAQTLNGFGTKLYGKRECKLDGSFLTTKWIVLFWIPLVPLKSYRVKHAGQGQASFLPGWSRRYLVLSEFGPDLRQAVNVYSLVALFLVGGWLSVEADVGSTLSWIALLLWAFIPWTLRKAVQKRG